MEIKKDELIGKPPQTIRPESVGSRTGIPMETKTKAIEAGLNVAQAVCSVVLSAAMVTVDGQRLKQVSDAEWENTKRRIAEIEAGAAAEVEKLKTELEKTKESTKKLEIITNLIATRPDLQPEIREGLRSALDNLTR